MNHAQRGRVKSGIHKALIVVEVVGVIVPLALLVLYFGSLIAVNAGGPKGIGMLGAELIASAWGLVSVFLLLFHAREGWLPSYRQARLLWAGVAVATAVILASLVIQLAFTVGIAPEAVMHSTTGLFALVGTVGSPLLIPIVHLMMLRRRWKAPEPLDASQIIQAKREAA